MALNLGGILAGLGQGAGLISENYQKQQDAQIRRAMLQVYLQNQQRQQQQQQETQQAGNAEWSQLLGGTGGMMPTLPGATKIPMAEPAPDPTSFSPAPGGSGMSSGISDPRGLVPYIRQEAQRYGIAPDVAVKVAASEGLGNPVGDKGTSFGALQLHVGGGMGDDFKRSTGLDPSQPQNERAGIDYALSQVPKTGWTPFHGAARVGIGPRQGIVGQNDNAEVGASGSPGPDGQPGAPSAEQPQAPATVPSAGDLRKRLNAIIPPDVNGKMSDTALAQKIDQAYPNLPGAVKLKIYNDERARLAPVEQEKAKRAWEQYKTQVDAEIKDWERANKLSDEQRKRAEEPGTILETDKGPMRVRPGSNEAQPITLPGGAHVIGTKGGESQPHNIVAFKDGEKVFEGSAKMTPTGWVNSATGEPIVSDRVEDTGKGAAGGAGRSGAQVQRQIIAAREIQSDLENVSKMPISTNRGIFGGRQQGPGLLDALKENLAETLTDEDAQLTNSALANLERELSIVTSPVYGGKWAAQSFGALSLKPGQTNLVKLYNLARMRQTVDNALEGVVNTDWVGAQQKDYAKAMRESITKAIPWTPAEVLAFREKAGDQDTFRSFVEKNRVVEQQQDAAPTGPKEGDIATAPGKPDLVYRGGTWVPAQ